MDTDVLVVGGGATGVGVARDLAMRGVDVVLAERDGLAAGTTGRTHGVLHSGARYADEDARAAAACLEENRTLRRIAGECVRDTGGLFVSLAADDPDYADRKAAACRDAGIDVSWLDDHEYRERVPGLADDVTRAFAVPDGVVRPSRLVAATAADARDHGARVHTDAPVTALHVDGGAVTGATVGGSVDRRVEAETVVNAAGPWAGRVADLADVDAGLAPTRGVMVAVEYEGLGPVLNRCRSPDDGDIVVPHPSAAVLGTTSVAVDDPDAFEEADWEVERSREECARMLPGVADAPAVRTWWGVRPLYEPDERARGGGRGISRDFAVLDHGDEGVDGLFSVVGGKLTTHREMAEAVSDRAAEREGVTAACRTADEPLAAADDPDRLDALVEQFDAGAPAEP